jgi:hypothetical protein
MKNHGYVLAAVLALSFVASSARSDITTGLIAKYPFDGNATDVSGNGNHGSLVGGVVLTTDRFGTPNSAYNFPAYGSYILVPGSTSLNSPTTAVTQAAWVSIHGLGFGGSQFNPLIMKSVESGNAFMYRMITDPTYFGAAFNNWNTATSSGRATPADEWHHFATVFNGTTLRFYYDGAFVESKPLVLTITPDTRALTIGADFPGIPEFFNGKIDDVYLFSRALSDADIAQLYSATTTGVEEPTRMPGVALGRPFPNPGRAQIKIDFDLESSALVQLAIYDAAGRRIRGLRSGVLEKGTYSTTWDVRDDSGNPVPAGVYFFQLRAGERRLSTRVLRVR